MQPQLITVAEGVHAWIGAGGDSNAGAIETPDGSRHRRFAICSIVVASWKRRASGGDVMRSR